MSTNAPALARQRDQTLTNTRPPRGLWSDAWRRLRRNKMAVAGLIYLAFLLIVAIFAPWIASHNPVQTDVRNAGVFRKAAWVEDPNPLRAGKPEYILGSDSVGRDVFSRLVYGTRVSLVVGIVPALLTLLIGVTIGLISGFVGGWVDNVLMRITDVVWSFPVLIFFIVMQISFKDTWFGNLLNGLVLLFVTLSVVAWPGVARLVRGQVLSLKEKEFVEAARTIGSSNWKIITRHLLPNTLGPIIVAGAFIVPGAIITEAVLSYLGIGIRPSIDPDYPFPASWGNMLLDGSKAWQAQSWMLIAPSLAVGLIYLAFTALGDGLRDALDPRETK